MTGMSGAIWVPAHPTNIIRSRRNVPRVNVYHTPEEPADDIEVTPYYFQRPNLGASTHYYADNDGDLYQMVDEDEGAVANGVLGKPYPAGTDPSYSLNCQSRSIEIEGHAATIHLSCQRGSPQWLTVVRFCLAGWLRHGIPLDRAHNIGHYEVSRDRSDPGALDLDAIVEDARAMVEDYMALTNEEIEEAFINLYAVLYGSTAPDWAAVQPIVDGLRAQYPHGLVHAIQSHEAKIDALTERLDNARDR